MTNTPDPIDVEVGRRICSLRLSRGYNQSDLGRALGLTFQQIQKYEKGANRVSASKLVRVAQFLRVEPAYFLPSIDGDAEAAISPNDPMIALGALQHGHELARTFVDGGPAVRTAIIQCARAVTAPALQQAA